MDLSRSLDVDIEALNRIHEDSDTSDDSNDDAGTIHSIVSHSPIDLHPRVIPVVLDDNYKSDAPNTDLYATWDDEIAVLRDTQKDDSSDDEDNIARGSTSQHASANTFNECVTSSAFGTTTTPDSTSWEEDTAALRNAASSDDEISIGDDDDLVNDAAEVHSPSVHNAKDAEKGAAEGAYPSTFSNVSGKYPSATGCDGHSVCATSLPHMPSGLSTLVNESYNSASASPSIAERGSSSGIGKDATLHSVEECLARNREYQQHLKATLQRVKSALWAVRAAKEDLIAEGMDRQQHRSTSGNDGLIYPDEYICTVVNQEAKELAI